MHKNRCGLYFSSSTITVNCPCSIFYYIILGSFFGERSLLKREPRAATATVISDEATALALTKGRFEELLGSLEDMTQETEATGKRATNNAKGKGGATRAMDTIKYTDFKRLGLLGCGAFGGVTLEQHKETGKTYALKMLSKGFIVKTKMQAGVMREKEILAVCDSDFVVKLHATFKNKDHLYFLLEPCLGGELYATYLLHGDAKKAKFFSGTVVFCFEHSHQRNILYRDLKPENLLLDGKGDCKITDMGHCSDQMSYLTCAQIFMRLSQTGAWGYFDELSRISIEVLSVVSAQYKSILDAIREGVKSFLDMDEDIKLAPTIGAFITMNPGYAGRTELPENLKALFRNCAMISPDLTFICENMLMSERFVFARPLSRKFVTLCGLSKELLSKQMHYDWGLRAVKSLLRQAGKLKRKEPEADENPVLCSALRDFNTSKITANDMPIFLRLIQDLFTGVWPAPFVNVEFTKIGSSVNEKRGLQADHQFVMKVVGLLDILFVRHCCLIIGSVGCSKTEIWKSLMVASRYVGQQDGVWKQVNPKAITSNELCGIMTKSKERKMSAILRNASKKINGFKPRLQHKRVTLNDDIDAEWVESMHTVMDDNKVLTVVSNDRIAFTATSMRMLLEITDMKCAATVSRGRVIDVVWKPFAESWREKLNQVAQSTFYIEPPQGLPANLRRAFALSSRDEVKERDQKAKAILFGFCRFHSIMLERKKFGSMGYNMMYPFAAHDLRHIARLLSRKFVTLYGLSKELLSKQLHYDWGLKAMKSLLRQAGKLKRKEPEADENPVLCRALRDFNTPKITTNDMPIFIRLSQDLFTGVWPEPFVDVEFTKIGSSVIKKCGLQADHQFVIKVVGLLDILFVRHWCFIIGPVGCSKTETWKSLMVALRDIGQEGLWEQVNPKAITSNELYGIMTKSKEWKDGAISVFMRSVTKEINGYKPSHQHKWAILDGDMDAVWIESMNTVMDDNKVLTLVSNERTTFTATMRMLLGIQDMKCASPATVSRRGVLYGNETDVGWKPFVESWREKLDPVTQSTFYLLFSNYFEANIDSLRKMFPKVLDSAKKVCKKIENGCRVLAQRTKLCKLPSWHGFMNKHTTCIIEDGNSHRTVGMNPKAITDQQRYDIKDAISEEWTLGEVIKSEGEKEEIVGEERHHDMGSGEHDLSTAFYKLGTTFFKLANTICTNILAQPFTRILRDDGSTITNGGTSYSTSLIKNYMKRSKPYMKAYEQEEDLVRALFQDLKECKDFSQLINLLTTTHLIPRVPAWFVISRVSNSAFHRIWDLWVQYSILEEKGNRLFEYYYQTTKVKCYSKPRRIQEDTLICELLLDIELQHDPILCSEIVKSATEFLEEQHRQGYYSAAFDIVCPSEHSKKKFAQKLKFVQDCSAITSPRCTTFQRLLLLLCGDIEQNPGPNTPQESTFATAKRRIRAATNIGSALLDVPKSIISVSVPKSIFGGLLLPCRFISGDFFKVRRQHVFCGEDQDDNSILCLESMKSEALEYLIYAKAIYGVAQERGLLSRCRDYAMAMKVHHASSAMEHCDAFKRLAKVEDEQIIFADFEGGVQKPMWACWKEPKSSTAVLAVSGSVSLWDLLTDAGAWRAFEHAADGIVRSLSHLLECHGVEKLKGAGHSLGAAVVARVMVKLGDEQLSKKRAYLFGCPPLPDVPENRQSWMTYIE